MAERLRAEAADTSTSYLSTVNGSLSLCGVGLEELALVVVARPPRQAAADVQPLALDVQEHVLGQHAFGRVRVVAQPAAWMWWSPLNKP